MFELSEAVKCEKLRIAADISMDASIQAHDDIGINPGTYASVEFSLTRFGIITLMQEEY